MFPIAGSQANTSFPALSRRGPPRTKVFVFHTFSTNHIDIKTGVEFNVALTYMMYFGGSAWKDSPKNPKASKAISHYCKEPKIITQNLILTLNYILRHSTAHFGEEYISWISSFEQSSADQEIKDASEVNESQQWKLPWQGKWQPWLGEAGASRNLIQTLFSRPW